MNQPINQNVVIIYVLRIDSKNQKKLVSYGNQSLEACFDTVSTLAAKGWLIREVVLFADSQLMPLPAEVFDGKNFSTPLAQLKSEWESILAD